MAIHAQNADILDTEPQRFIFGEWHDVVGVQVVFPAAPRTPRLHFSGLLAELAPAIVISSPCCRWPFIRRFGFAFLTSRTAGDKFTAAQTGPRDHIAVASTEISRSFLRSCIANHRSRSIGETVMYSPPVSSHRRVNCQSRALRAIHSGEAPRSGAQSRHNTASVFTSNTYPSLWKDGAILRRDSHTTGVRTCSWSTQNHSGWGMLPWPRSLRTSHSNRSGYPVG